MLVAYPASCSWMLIFRSATSLSFCCAEQIPKRAARAQLPRHSLTLLKFVRSFSARATTANDANRVQRRRRASNRCIAVHQAGNTTHQNERQSSAHLLQNVLSCDEPRQVMIYRVIVSFSLLLVIVRCDRVTVVSLVSDFLT